MTQSVNNKTQIQFIIFHTDTFLIQQFWPNILLQDFKRIKNVFKLIGLDAYTKIAYSWTSYSIGMHFRGELSEEKVTRETF